MNELQIILKNATEKLKSSGIDNPSFDAAEILEKHCKIPKYKFCIYDKLPENFDKQSFLSDIKRRANHEPLQYILSVWNFYGFDFFVGSGVLIPRQDTEILCEKSIECLKSTKEKRFLELCGGSGCISTVIAKTVENSHGVCIELSDDALTYLNKNLDFHHLKNCVSVIKSDVLKTQTACEISKKYGSFDVILSNPPYIKSDIIKTLSPEVKDYEPSMALDGGKDGLIFYRFFKNYIRLLKNHGVLLCEIGYDQSEDVKNLFESFGLHDIFIINDLSGLPRVVGGYR